MTAGAHEAPRVMASSPANGATNVDPASVMELTVTFDQDMGSGMSWCGGGSEFPETAEGKNGYWKDARTCVLPVKLEAGRYYHLGINSMTYKNFRSADGRAARPSELAFTTMGARAEMVAKLPRPKAAATAEAKEEAFDQLWQAFDKDYAMFAIKPEVDWKRLGEEYRARALEAKTTDDFAAVCAEMLEKLRDLHVWLTVSGENVPVFNRPRMENANPAARNILFDDYRAFAGGGWAKTSDGMGYLAIDGWDNPLIPTECDAALEALRDTRAMVVDVRVNGGGSENLALQVAGRFLDKPFVYGYDEMRNGPKPSDLTEREARRIEPRGPWQYHHPVILLIGQKCMSSNESFVGMMTGDTHLVTMGDHTCGSSGNPEIVRLPLDMTVSVPRWIDYLPDGTPLDERGFQPQVRFRAGPDSFSGGRDELLSAALERLRRTN